MAPVYPPEYHMLYVLCPFVTYLLTLPRSYTNLVKMDVVCSRLQNRIICTFGLERLVRRY
jgi:hypothetical protein